MALNIHHSFREVPSGILVVSFVGLGTIYLFALLMTFGTPVFAINAYLQLVYFSVLVLSFLGATNWGIAISASARGISVSLWWYLVTACPMALGWLTLVVVSPTIKIVLLSLGFFFTFMLDVSASVRGYAPLWYKNFRKLMTTAVLIAMLLALVAIRSSIMYISLG